MATTQNETKTGAQAHTNGAKAATQEANTEEELRLYLLALKDSSVLIDAEALQKVQAALAGTSDPLARIMLRAQEEKLAQPDISRLEDAFVAHAKTWATDQGLNGAVAKLFQEEGVPAEVLRRAGFDMPAPPTRSRRGSRGKATTTPAPPASGKRASTEDVIKGLPDGEFTVKQLIATSGAAPATARKAVQEALADGKIEDLGNDPNPKGPGRASRLYRKV